MQSGDKVWVVWSSNTSLYEPSEGTVLGPGQSPGSLRITVPGGATFYYRSTHVFTTRAQAEELAALLLGHYG